MPESITQDQLYQATQHALDCYALKHTFTVEQFLSLDQQDVPDELRDVYLSVKGVLDG